MVPPKSGESKAEKASAAEALEMEGPISTKAELKKFLLRIRDRMDEDIAAPIYAVIALNHILSMSNIYTLLDNENKEVARDIWLRVKKSGMQVRNPPMLFSPDELNGA